MKCTKILASPAHTFPYSPVEAHHPDIGWFKSYLVGPLDRTGLGCAGVR